VVKNILEIIQIMLEMVMENIIIQMEKYIRECGKKD
jgi:hypothetical protein